MATAAIRGRAASGFSDMGPNSSPKRDHGAGNALMTAVTNAWAPLPQCARECPAKLDHQCRHIRKRSLARLRRDHNRAVAGHTVCAH
jgi:hypothetical protein